VLRCFAYALPLRLRADRERAPRDRSGCGARPTHDSDQLGDPRNDAATLCDRKLCIERRALAARADSSGSIRAQEPPEPRAQVERLMLLLRLREDALLQCLCRVPYVSHDAVRCIAGGSATSASGTG